MIPSRARIAAFLALIAALIAPAKGAEPLRVGSKRFTESYVLGELLAQSAERAGERVELRPGLGNTAILFEALSRGAIDAYPEYTGTIAREILKQTQPLDLAGLNRRLAPMGLAASIPLGFSDGYALGIRESVAAAKGIATVSDLARHGDLALGLSHEFLRREDGWPGLKAAYALPQASPRGLDHGLAYEALGAGQVDVIDIYTTDAKIARFAVRVLIDDRGFFPRYDAVVLHRIDAPARHPAAFAAWKALEGRLDERTMIRLNARAELDRVPFDQVAGEFLGGGPAGASRGLWSAVFAPDFARLAIEHVTLVFASLAAAVALGVPMGVLAARVRAFAQPVLALAGLVQTVPSLALLAFLIPLTGIGAGPALLALFLYALLPIARNTHAGLLGVPRGLRDAALALGLTPGQSLARIELPLALPMILAGVKTSAVVNVGTATIAAFVGAGGFGERIAQGLAVNDNALLLAGAIPAAALALAVHAAFELGERWLCPAPAPGAESVDKQ
ncbi:MAG: ABC transporter permease subunit [Betaproteobacteria bacterium]|nr:ABC transporter permease subunit [Betaproteobacteria bacterium]